MPAPLATRMVAQKIAVLPEARFRVDFFTGADFHPDGRRLVLRTATDGGTLTEVRNTGASWDDIWKTETSELVGPWTGTPEGGAEAVTYSRSGVSLYTFSEGTNRRLARTGCR